MKPWFSVFILLFYGCVALAAPSTLVDVNYQGKVQAGSKNQARKAIVDQAVAETSRQYIHEIIGESKAQKNKALIESKVIQNYLKYIPILKVNRLEREGDGVVGEVVMKVSVDNLRQLLLKEGLLYEIEGPPKALPMVRISDRVNSQSYAWWVQDDEGQSVILKDMMSHFNGKLKAELREHGFFGLSPVTRGFVNLVPGVFRTEKPRTEDYLIVGQLFASAIVIRGEYKITALSSFTDKYHLDVRLEALQSSNGRVIGEIIRQYETEMGPFQAVVNKKILEVNEVISKDLVAQILDAWQKGTFGSSLLQLTLRGDLQYKQMEALKAQLLDKVKSIRGLRARFFGPSEVTFEVDSSITATQLAETIRQQKFSPFKVEVDQVKANKLALNVKTR